MNKDEAMLFHFYELMVAASESMKSLTEHWGKLDEHTRSALLTHLLETTADGLESILEIQASAKNS